MDQSIAELKLKVTSKQYLGKKLIKSHIILSDKNLSKAKVGKS